VHHLVHDEETGEEDEGEGEGVEGAGAELLGEGRRAGAGHPASADALKALAVAGSVQAFLSGMMAFSMR